MGIAPRGGAETWACEAAGGDSVAFSRATPRDACPHQWFNQTRCQVNGSFVRLGLEGRMISLRPRQGVVIPKGVMHRPQAPRRSSILMVETSAIVPTGD